MLPNPDLFYLYKTTLHPIAYQPFSARACPRSANAHRKGRCACRAPRVSYHYTFGLPHPYENPSNLVGVYELNLLDPNPLLFSCVEIIYTRPACLLL